MCFYPVVTLSVCWRCLKGTKRTNVFNVTSGNEQIQMLIYCFFLLLLMWNPGEFFFLFYGFRTNELNLQSLIILSDGTF